MCPSNLELFPPRLTPILSPGKTLIIEFRLPVIADSTIQFDLVFLEYQGTRGNSFSQFIAVASESTFRKYNH